METQAPKITFKRIERDCPHNEEIRAAGESKGILYDFEVYVDGELRAYFVRWRGTYELRDADRKNVTKRDDWHWCIDVRSQAAFEATILEWLAAGRIPTVAQIAARREADAHAAFLAECEESARAELEQVESCGVKLLRALERLTIQMERNRALMEAADEREYQNALAVIAEARGATA